ncbi:hypothetical protein [Streptomyces sp. NPDC058653]|uniref:hypothetical protein n=1 Tax=Streptomyces sp. NPDC058653 TaxID=3346576 RepID=UPI0036575B1E
MDRGRLPLATGTGAGLAFILWLLLSSPDPGLAGAECRPALNLNWTGDGTGHSSFEDSKAAVTRDPDRTANALNVCSSKQNTRLSGALLLSMPTGVAAGMLIARRRDARPAEEPVRRWVPPRSVADERDGGQGGKDR